jgi:polysaccharide pyruvyl transferase WcaK-like protein
VRIAFWGNFGTLNLGNECTLAAALYNLRKRLPHAQLISVCSAPEDTAARHGIRAIPIGRASGSGGDSGNNGRYAKPLRILRRIGLEARAWLRAFRQASSIDALLITGTGILTDDGEGAFGLPYELFKWSLVTKIRGGKLFFVSVGVESIARPLARVFVRSALRLADYRCYRDLRSAALLQTLGFRADRDVVCPDLAFSLPQTLAAAAEPLGSRRCTVAVGLFNYRDRGYGSSAAASAYRAYVDRICSLILWLLEHDYSVRVVIGDLTYDEGVRADVRTQLQARGLDLASPCFADEPAASFEQLLGQLAAVDFVIATRFHNVLLALLLGKPVVSVSYEGKNEALMREMGLGEYCQALDSLDLERLIEQFLDLQKNADSLRDVVAGRTAANRVRLDEQYDLIARSACGSAAGARA